MKTTTHNLDRRTGVGHLFRVMTALFREQQRRVEKGNGVTRLPMRPDHGHMLIADAHRKYYPGYSLLGRMRGLAELRGLEMGISRSLQLSGREAPGD